MVRTLKDIDGCIGTPEFLSKLEHYVMALLPLPEVADLLGVPEMILREYLDTNEEARKVVREVRARCAYELHRRDIEAMNAGNQLAAERVRQYYQQTTDDYGN